MKTRNIWMAFFCLMGICLTQGCSVEDEDMVGETNQKLGNSNAGIINAQSVQALVTTVTAEDGTFYLRESEKRLLRPVNLKTSPFGNKEVRAMVFYNETVQAGTPNVGVIDVYVTWIDNIYTQSSIDMRVEAQREAMAEKKKNYGEETIDIVNDWVNSLTDGYLTLHYKTDGPKVSDILLLTGNNPDDPYELTLWAVPAASDSSTMLVADSLIAYKVNGLPPTNGEVKIVTLRWLSPNGWKTAQFYFRTE